MDSGAILLVEDSEDDAFAFKWAAKKAQLTNPLFAVTDGRQAISYFSGEGQYANREVFPLPAVVFLDLKLPYYSGLEVLAWIRQQPSLHSVSTVILSGSNESRDRDSTLALGVDRYLVKPVEPEVLKQIMETLEAA